MNSARLKVFCSQEEKLHKVSIQKAKTFFAVTLCSERKRKKENLAQVQNKTLGAHLYIYIKKKNSYTNPKCPKYSYHSALLKCKSF